MKNKQFPSSMLGLTHRQYKQQKRKQFRELKKAFDKLRLGIAYAPIYARRIDEFVAVEDGRKRSPWMDMEALMKQMEHELSYKEWGR